MSQILSGLKLPLRRFFSLAACSVLTLSTIQITRADVAAPPPIFARVAQSQTIVVGDVVGVEDRDQLAFPNPRIKRKVRYRIAVVRIQEALRGPKEKKIIRVAFVAPPQPGVPRASSGYMRLKIGQHGMFFLNKHYKEPFYLIPNYYDFQSGDNNKQFPQQVAYLKKVIQFSKNAATALTSKDPEERLLAAAFFISKYRTVPHTRPIKMAEIDVAESKLIMLALANADWKKPHVSLLGGMPLTPLYVFSQLGVGAKDGFVPPRNARNRNAYPEAAQAWLRKNASTFRIKRFVGGVGKAEK